jgi:hypothetical protein
MKNLEVLGEIFYNYDAIDITHCIYSSLFDSATYLNQGAESLVYDAGEYVYKIKKLGVILIEDLIAQISNIKKNDAVFLEEEPIGYLTHKLDPFVKHLVTRQKKINPVSSEHDILMALIKQGWNPLVTSYEKDGTVIYDIKPENCGIDKDGNIKIIDYMSYIK